MGSPNCLHEQTDITRVVLNPAFSHTVQLTSDNADVSMLPNWRWPGQTPQLLLLNAIKWLRGVGVGNHEILRVTAEKPEGHWPRKLSGPFHN